MKKHNTFIREALKIQPKSLQYAMGKIRINNPGQWMVALYEAFINTVLDKHAPMKKIKIHQGPILQPRSKSYEFTRILLHKIPVFWVKDTKPFIKLFTDVRGP